MDYTNLALGVAALGFGLYTSYLRVTNKFSNSQKLIQMKERFGEKIGNTIHLIAYTILPLTFGFILLLSIYLNF